jgi:hypothetical protein
MDNPIISSTEDPLYVKRTAWLKNQIDNVLRLPMLSFSEIINITDMGLYLIYDNKELLYVGMTTRGGNLRLSEIASSFRSHTFNRKLLAEHFRGLNYNMHALNPKTYRKLWIETNLITIDDFRSAQRQVNHYIKSGLKYRFYETRYVNLPSIEHYAMATLQPLYND